MLGLAKDLRSGLRGMRNSPLVTAVAVVTLALGIGANSAVFSVVYNVVLKPFPFDRPERLVLVAETSRQRNLTGNPVAPANYLDFKSQSRTLHGMAAVGSIAFTYSERGRAVRVEGAEVSPNFFDVLGVKPILGRLFTPEEDRPGSDNVVIIADTFWKRGLGGDPNVIGKAIRLNSRPYTVVGIVKRSASLLFGDGELWKPLGWDYATAHDRATQDYIVVARLGAGATLRAAQDELTGISEQLARQYPATNTDWSADVTALGNAVGKAARQQLVLLLAMVALVLLIACVNLASLFSARINARRREIATCLALGASRRRLVQQLLAESVLVSLTGGLLGVAVAYAGLPLLLASLPPDLPRIGAVKLDAVTLLYTFLLSILAGLLFGLSPTLQAAREEIYSQLQNSARGTSRGAGQQRFLNGLVVTEIALSMVLLVGAGLVLRSVAALRRVDPGFQPLNVLVNTLLVLPQDKYRTSASRQYFFNRLLGRIRTLPGVLAAGGITALPLQGNSDSTGFRIAGDAQTDRGRERGAVVNTVTEYYFEAMGIPLRRGRAFSQADNALSPGVAVINDTLARRYFAGRNPIGQRIFLAGHDTAPLEIAGVVGSTRQFALREEPSPEIFTPFLQSNAYFLYVVVRTRGDPEKLAEPIRHEVAAIDPEQPVGHRTLQRQIEEAITPQRVLAELLGLFATLALVLAAVGIYGVMSYGVAQRTREIGIRMALGALPRTVLGMVLVRAARLALLGVSIGGVAAIALSHLIAPLLFGIGALDVLTYSHTAIMLLGIALLASLGPAHKASHVDPMIAMRHE